MTMPQQVPPSAPQQNSDTGSFGWAVLGFFVPLAGLILWIIWKDTRPKDSIQSRNGFIVGLIVGVIASIIYAVAIAATVASIGSGY